jgi:uncharacterized protein
MGFIDQYRKTGDLPQSLAVFPLNGALLLPRAELPLNVFEPRYLDMIADAMAGSRLIGMIQPQDDKADVMGRPLLSKVGCAGRITAYQETPDSRLMITLTGVCRFVVETELIAVTTYRQVQPDYEPYGADLIKEHGQSDVDRPGLLKAFKDYLDANNLSADWEQVQQASNETLVNTLSLLAPYPPKEKQALLEAGDLKTRAAVLVALTELALGKSGAGPSTRLQ